jgi:hypothetical protein
MTRSPWSAGCLGPWIGELRPKVLDVVGTALFERDQVVHLAATGEAVRASGRPPTSTCPGRADRPTRTSLVLLG